ncbi:hypothetical protein KP509_17G005000 [Ceratopteris richardii]|uniref:RING-type domain-containing protein n=1 Tax=Ceratopteris richardii TaxID=49495 RepID=A0A8T2SRP8_CERRI|nr:hypothetical protein KP509_17G005000 [Ceratopteris richardii]
MIATAQHQDMTLDMKRTSEQCGICCIPISTRGVLDCCSDIFCFSCIDTWSAFTNVCPVCKLQFNHITFVPVEDEEDASDIEIQETFFDFLGQERTDSWIDDTEEDGILSFPSYFIEEDAVVCLDGDGCRVRTGLSEEDKEPGLEDTSVACDSCDCWYHAVCVGYKPDSQGARSWICPRCVGTGVLNLFKFPPPSNHLLVKNKSVPTDKDGLLTFVDEGETAVVVSMDAARFNHTLDKRTDEAALRTSNEGGIEKSLDGSCQIDYVQAKKNSEGLSASDVCAESGRIAIQSSNLSQPETSVVEDVDSQLHATTDNFLTCVDDNEETGARCSMPSASGNEDPILDNPTASLNHVPLVNSEESTCKTIEPPPPRVEKFFSTSLIACKQPPSQSSEACSSNQNVGNAMDRLKIARDRKQTNASKESKIVNQTADFVNRQERLSKRPEPEGSLSEKQQRDPKKLKSEQRGPPLIKSLKLQTGSLKENASSAIPVQASGKEIIMKLVKEDLNESNMSDSYLSMPSKYDGLSVQDILKPKSESMNELTELVQNPVACHRRIVPPRANANNATDGTNEGVRTRKIIYRGSVLDENVSRIINEMRKQLKREEISFGVSGDISKVDVTDEKFFRAFKTAIQSTQLNLGLHHQPPTKKAVLPKPRSKQDLSRQSLMKKLYGGSGKRRQTWDRDWDISFWREKVTREKKEAQSSKTLLEQEMANIEAVKQVLKASSRADLESLKGRVYLADTSLLPRNEDIKPLSEKNIAKSDSHKVHKGKPVGNLKVGDKVSKHVVSREVHCTEVSDGNQPLKTDKQKWALQVLARKTGQSAKSQRKNESLLAGLPMHMRPVLEYFRRSKVPTATRQVQLDRFVEHFLQQLSIESIGDNSECQAAISAAVDKEKEIYDKSNSKGVYINLCVQALASIPKFGSSNEESTSAVTATESSSLLPMKSSGGELVEAPDNEDSAVLSAWKAAGLVSEDSPPGSPCIQHEQIGTVDVCSKDFEDQDDCRRNLSDVGNISALNPSHCVETLDSSISNLGRDTNADEQENIQCGEIQVGGEELPMSATPIGNQSIDLETVQENREPGAERIITTGSQQHEEKSFEQFTSLEIKLIQEGDLQETEQNCSVDMFQTQESDGEILSVNQGQQAHMNQEQPSDSVHEELVQGPVAGVKIEMESDSKERANQIFKQVESYVKEHIRPLHRSRIITSEQYKWAVGKTTNKVMLHHLHAESADFLITEGEKVRRLAEQYLKLYSERISPGE